jgi:hypothetical protein
VTPPPSPVKHAGWDMACSRPQHAGRVQREVPARRAVRRGRRRTGAPGGSRRALASIRRFRSPRWNERERAAVDTWTRIIPSIDTSGLDRRGRLPSPNGSLRYPDGSNGAGRPVCTMTPGKRDAPLGDVSEVPHVGSHVGRRRGVTSTLSRNSRRSRNRHRAGPIGSSRMYANCVYVGELSL